MSNASSTVVLVWITTNYIVGMLVLYYVTHISVCSIHCCEVCLHFPWSLLSSAQYYPHLSCLYRSRYGMGVLYIMTPILCGLYRSRHGMVSWEFCTQKRLVCWCSSPGVHSPSGTRLTHHYVARKWQQEWHHHEQHHPHHCSTTTAVDSTSHTHMTKKHALHPPW